jgi:hypothetical protein
VDKEAGLVKYVFDVGLISFTYGMAGGKSKVCSNEFVSTIHLLSTMKCQQAPNAPVRRAKTLGLDEHNIDSHKKSIDFFMQFFCRARRFCKPRELPVTC